MIFPLGLSSFLSSLTPPLAVLLVAFIHGQKVFGFGKVVSGGDGNGETGQREKRKGEAKARV